jgi:hypothetical protein
MAIESKLPHGDNSKSKWRSGKSSFLISVVTHVLILIALLSFGAFTVTQGTSEVLRPGGIVLTQADANTQTEYLTETDVAKLDMTPAADANATPAQSASAMPAPELDTPQPLDLPGIAPPRIEMDANSMTEVPTFAAEKVQYELTEADLQQLAKDRKFFEAQRPKGAPTQVSIFGGGAVAGRKFVFVIDRSHSMGGEGLGVLNRARAELVAAIAGLQDNHEFQIVAYHDSTIVISERKLLGATEENKQRVAPFFENVGAFGATNHYYGLLVGLGFKPDVLMFMTDGGSPDLTPDEIKRVKKMAGGKTQIHCIEFGSGGLQKTTSFMKKIAQQNQGSYRYIDVNKWRSGRR